MYPSSLAKNQTGFLLPVAIFLVVGIAAMAIGVSRLSSQAGTSTFREGVAMQALYAAESGMQWGMNQLLFPDSDRATATSNCASIADPDPLQAELNFSIPGLQGCSVNVSCSSEEGTEPVTFYTLVSAASCGGGELLAERTVRATAYIRE